MAEDQKHPSRPQGPSPAWDREKNSRGLQEYLVVCDEGRLAALVLLGVVGLLKFSDREERDIADLYATPLATFEALEYVDSPQSST